VGRKQGQKNRTYPPLKLAEAVKVAEAIQDKASGMEVTRLTLAELIDVAPGSSRFGELVASSRMYGLTNGGINADEFSLSTLGEEATSGDEVVRAAAYKRAVANVEPYQAFITAFSGKKIPGPTPFKEFLVRNAGVSADRAEECMSFILADAETAGLIRSMKGTPYIDTTGTTLPSPVEKHTGDEEAEPALTKGNGAGNGSSPLEESVTFAQEKTPPPALGAPKKVFIAHGKNRTPLEQLKKALDTFKVSYAVAVDEANKGRPISKKVATLMRDECSSGIFIFTADEKFMHDKGNGEMEEVWRPSENVVYELGAASILYENRIVIFKERSVTFPTDFSDLGFIPFEKDQLVAELGNLFKELVALDILEVRAKG
jgi:predicted nucleotide-binding protein with TIR-like domain